METCALCNKKMTEIENVETKFAENESVIIASINLEFSPVYEISKRLECKSCNTILYGLNMDGDSQNDPILSCFPKSLTLPEGRLKAVTNTPNSSLLTV